MCRECQVEDQQAAQRLHFGESGVVVGEKSKVDAMLIGVLRFCNGYIEPGWSGQGGTGVK